VAVFAEPPLVRRALALADSLGFERSCSPETGRFLHVLAARRGLLRVGEIGTGTGVGAAWIVSALPPQAPFVTVELDAERAAAAAELFADDPYVRVLVGDWRAVLPAEAPFDLLFVDGGKAKAQPEVVGLLAPGGTAFIDDLTPGRPGPDPVRELWLGHPDLVSVEVVVSPEEAVVVAVRAR
jgi:predicted O-methyltransferase YrrM